jgi:hypothetical protein
MRFFLLFRLGDGAARFGQAIIVLVLVLLAIGFLMSAVGIGEPSAHDKEIQCYAGEIGPPPGAYDCINYVQPNWQP